MSLNAEWTRSERERAFTRFEAIERVHSAAMETFRIVATLPDAPALISTSVRLRLGMTPDLTSERADDHADQILETLAAEKARDYEVIRGSALVAVCGAFEYLVKATFVDQAACAPQQAAALLAKSKIRLSANEVLGTSVSEQWFAIADRLFEQMAESHPQMYQRVQRLLLDFTAVDQAQTNMLRKSFKRADPKKFNEAFLVRNCLVHNGGRVGAQLARASGLSVGDPISLARPRLQVMLRPIRELAQALNVVWMTL